MAAFLKIAGVLLWLAAALLFFAGKTIALQGVGAIIGVSGCVMFSAGAIVEAIAELKAARAPKL